MNRLLDQLDEVCRRRDVLRHPFYQRWTAGELDRDELAFYAGQYRHAVVALAEAAAQGGDRDHAEEERGHVELWDDFVRAVGGDVGAPAAPETAACATAWADGNRDGTATLAALYAIESTQPAISETKRTGLIAHYGAEPESAVTRYFDVHAVLDRAHAAQAACKLQSAARPGDEPRLVAEAERVLHANWRLLDGVQQASSR